MSAVCDYCGKEIPYEFNVNLSNSINKTRLFCCDICAVKWVKREEKLKERISRDE